jgi:membrane protease YdiL (CAAX protease family)
LSEPAETQEEKRLPSSINGFTNKEILAGLIFFILILGFSFIFNSLFIFWRDSFKGASLYWFFQALVSINISFQALATIGVVYLVAVRRLGWKKIGLTNFRYLNALFTALLTYLLFFVFELAYNYLLVELLGSPAPPTQDLKPLFGSGTTGYFLALTLGGIVAPIAEEFFFRGFFYTALRSRWGIKPALIFSSLIFALFHLSFLLFPLLFLMGVLLALLYERRGSLDASFLLHILNNIVAITFSYFWGGL